MRTLILSIFALSTLRVAAADPVPRPTDYPPLAAAKPVTTNNAAAIAIACRIGMTFADGSANAAKQCADAGLTPVLAFCRDPLAAPAPPLTTGQINVLIGKCAVPTQDARVAQHGESPVGGTGWQSEVINGLVAFLVKRAKAEALASLIDHLKTDVCASDVAAYMPTTCGLLANTQPYTDPTAWGALKAAFETDLRTLPETLIHKATHSDAAEPLWATIEAATLIERGDRPIEVLIGLKTKYASIATPVACKRTPYACALRLFGSTVEILDPPKNLDPTALELELKIAASLLVREGGSVGLGPEILSAARGDATIQALRGVHQAIAAVQAALPAAAKAKAVLDSDKSKDTRDKARSAFTDYLVAVAAVLKTVPAVAMIPELQAVIDRSSLQAALEHLTHAIDHARAGEYIQAFVELQATLTAARIPVPAWFSKYGGFIAEVAAAKTRADVETALEAAAAPVGAWRTKRGDGHHTLTLNGYVGIQGGYEWLSGSDSHGSKHGGLFAPVGLEASFGFGRSWSIGALISAIDLGALVDVRSDSGAAVNNTSTIGFRQVFSPGVHAVLGLCTLPFGLGVGVSLSPELRSTDDPTNPHASAVRFSVFLATDITILGF